MERKQEEERNGVLMDESNRKDTKSIVDSADMMTISDISFVF